ncbi:MAG TPA: hypothetical protein VNF08_04940 [Acidimicrobiales bacterium]|nr:hypothetical protein [Acidimicrobiales bacterium]
MDTVDRSSTGIQNPPLIPVDGDELDDDVEKTLDALHQSARVLDLSVPLRASLGVTPPLKAEGDSSRETRASRPSPTAPPDLNWLIALGEG